MVLKNPHYSQGCEDIRGTRAPGDLYLHPGPILSLAHQVWVSVPLMRTAKGWKRKLCLASQRTHLLPWLCPRGGLPLLGAGLQAGTGKGQISLCGRQPGKPSGEAPAQVEPEPPLSILVGQGRRKAWLSVFLNAQWVTSPLGPLRGSGRGSPLETCLPHSCLEP